MNWYTYAGNNPLRFVDPTGLTYEDFVEEMQRRIDQLDQNAAAFSAWKGSTVVSTSVTNLGFRDYLAKSAGGTEVAKAQASLTMAGYNLGKYGIDGKKGKETSYTSKAIAALQRAAGLKPSGELDRKTMAALDMIVAAGLKKDDIEEIGKSFGHIATDISDKGLAFIAQYEGFSNEVYYCPAGVPTIGYGHVVRPGESFEGGITKEEALRLLYSDVQIAVSAVNKGLKVSQNQHEFDALVSLAYNIGGGAFRRSSLLKSINEGDIFKIEHNFKLWVKAGGKTLKGLVNRRNDEYEMYSTGDYTRDHY